MHLPSRWLFSTLLSLTLVASTWADTVTLKDGSVREGKITQEDVKSVTIEIKFGSLLGTVRILRDDIASISRKPNPINKVVLKAKKLETTAKALQGIKAAEAWVKLGDYYSTQYGFSSLATESYEKALVAHQDHALAHQRLGHTKTKNGWQAINKEQRALGLVPLNKAWIKPEDRAWLIDKKHQDKFDVRIAPRKDRPLTEKEIKKQLKLKKAEEEFAKRDQLRLRHGQSLLSKFGYYLPNDEGLFIASSGTPYYVNGTGISSGDSSFFVGTVGAGIPPDYDNYEHRYGMYPGA